MRSYYSNPTREEIATLLGKQIKELREALGMDHAALGELLTRVSQADRMTKKKVRGYWIGLSYLPQYLKRWETGLVVPNWNSLVDLKRIADANSIPFDLPSDAAPMRIRRKLYSGNFIPADPLFLADLPDSLPSMRSGQAFAKPSKIRKWRKPNPHSRRVCPHCGN